MNNKLVLLDFIVFGIYFVLLVAYGYSIYLRKKKKETSATHDFFLAEGSLTWWAIGASLIASNISAEQFIGMSGDGFFVGTAVAVYEWFAALALVIIAIWFMPIYLKNKIYTMPQFLKTRYNETVALVMAVFWLFLYVLVNLTSILYLGAVAINGLAGGNYLHIIMVLLAIMGLVITLGGMKVIGYTDVFQVAVLIIGGLATTYLALTKVSETFGLGSDAIAGFKMLLKDSPDHFKMILDKPTDESVQLALQGDAAAQTYINKYLLLPGIAMYFAGQWIVNLNYWGCNQYITQRALGADLKTARTGILFAAFLKLLMPVIVMLPGIAAYVLHRNGGLEGFNGVKDTAYSSVLAFLPSGLKGLSVAALTAAIVASLAGKLNSISTIYTLDIYKKYINKDADEQKQVWVGRLAVLAAMVLALAFTWKDLLGIGGEGGFTFIQKYTGFISPGVFAMFLLGMFWKRTTGTAAIAGLLTGFILAIFFNGFAISVFGNETLLYSAFPNGKGGYEIPFLINMGWSFVFTILVMVVISLLGAKNEKVFEIDSKMFRLEPVHIVMAVSIISIIAALYAYMW
ncbi:MAG: sodium:solute symporter family transporter [Sphingobacteriales bacterium]|jgi:SSS family solute:Na+ symporter